MSKLRERVELSANMSIIFLAVLLGAILVKSYLVPSLTMKSTAAGDKISPGAQLSLNDVDFKSKEKTFIVALAKGCHFCSESAPFYRKLAQQAGDDGSVQLCFVFPHNLEEGKSYLDSISLSSVHAKQVNFRELGIRGTPTLILADNNGLVTDVWFGKLQSSEEEDVLAKLKPCFNCY